MNVQALLFAGILLVEKSPSIPLNVKADDPSGRTKVVFVHPEKFTDIKQRNAAVNSRDRSWILDNLERFFQKEANGYLSPQFRLTVNFTDIDLAGEFEWWRGSSFDTVRVVKDLYPPRMELAFKLRDASGTVVKEGERRLQNPAFLMGSQSAESNQWRHERDLFADWLRQEFREFRKK